MKSLVTITTAAIVLGLVAGSALAQQQTEFIWSPTGTEISDPMPAGLQNGIRGLSGPFDLDQDGHIEILASQHNSSGGRVHVFENTGIDTWELVYSTAFLDSSASSSNTRFATAGDLDGDGNWEIIYVAGVGYKADNPNWTLGAFIWEHDGEVGSDNYGTAPASIANFYDIDPVIGALATKPTSVYSQRLFVGDVDGDDKQELLVPANGPSAADVFYVLSVNGTYEPNGVGTGFETWTIEHRVNPREDGNAFGGGSPSEIIAADLDGDGNMEISFHSWNNFDFFNGRVTGPDQYELPALTADNRFLKASDEDDVALFGGVAVDIDGDGNDEVFYPNWQTKGLAVLDYSPGDDVLQITADHLVADVVELGGAGGVAVGDLDGDENLELIVGGGGYSASRRNAGLPSEFVRAAEFQGGDPTDGANWVVTAYNTSSPADTAGFSLVHRDSAGVMSSYYDLIEAKQGVLRNADDPIFPSGIAYLGDADEDGFKEIALSFQGVDDSLTVIDEVWNADSLRYERTVQEVLPAGVRPFLRIVSTNTVSTSVTDERIVLPSDYILEANYPNPFNPTTTFGFTLPLDKSVSVRVYDITGRLVRTLVENQLLTKGRHEVTWNGVDEAGATAASGTYLYTLEYGNFRQTRKMVLLK